MTTTRPANAKPTPDADDDYSRLAAAVTDGAILFAGAGVGCKTGYPTWSAMLSELERKAIAINEHEALSEQGTHELLRASVYKRLLGPTAFEEHIKTTFGPRHPAHHQDHEALVSIPFRHVLTTNYDHTLEAAHLAVHGYDADWFDAQDWPALTAFRQRQYNFALSRNYVHLHGSATNPSSIVLCREDYDRLYHNENRFRSFLTNLLIGSRLVFVGFSFSDTTFQHILEFARALGSPSDPRHFALLARPATEDDTRVQSRNLQGNYGIVPIYFDNASGNFSELWSLIRRLRGDTIDVAKRQPSGLLHVGAELLQETLQDDFDTSSTNLRRVSSAPAGQSLSAVNVTTDESSAVDAEIDSIFSLVKDGAPQAAVVRYEAIRKREGDALSARQRYRIDANIGNAWYEQGRFDIAATHYLAAAREYTDSPNALGIEVLGHLLSGNKTEAMRLAGALVDANPTFTRGWSLWVQAHDHSSDFSSIEIRVPESIRDDAEVAMALSGIASQQGLADDSLRYARIAKSAEPDWVEALSRLAHALLAVARDNAVFDPEYGSSPSDPAPVVEAESVLTTSIGLARDKGPSHYLPRLLFNRAASRRHLRRDADAAADLAEAFRLDPSDAAIVIGYGLNAETSDARDAAILALNNLAPDTEYHYQARFVLAYLLSRRNRNDDLSRSLNILVDLESRLCDIESHDLRWDIIRLGVRVRCERNNAADAEAAVVSLPADIIADYKRELAKAMASIRLDGIESSTKIVKDVLAVLPADAPWLVRRDAALLAMQGGDHIEALRIWKSLLPTTYSGVDTVHAITAAYYARDWRYVLDICARVRNAGRTTRQHLMIEVDVLSALREPDRAVALLNSWVNDHPDDRNAVLYLSALTLRIGKKDQAIFATDRLPGVEEVRSASDGQLLVQVLMHGPESSKALECAYAIYRRFPNDHDAHMALIGCIFDPTVELPDIDRPSQIGETSAALVGRTGESPRWVYVESGESPVVSRGEYAPEHRFIRAMWGRSVNDTFSYEGHQYTVVEIQHLVLRRIHDLMGQYEENFPERGLLKRFSVPSKPAPNAPMREKLGEVYEILERDDRHRQVLESMYRERCLPMSSFARFYGRPLFNTVRSMAIAGATGIRADDGDLLRWPVGLAIANNATELVLDGTAVAVASILDILDLLPRLGAKLIVPRAVLDELRRLSLEIAGPREFGGRLGIHDGTPYVHKLSLDEIAQEVTMLERAIDFINSHCEVVGGEATIDFDPGLLESLESLLETSSVDAIAAATQRGCPLWTDDLGLQRLLACEEFSVQTVWTQAVLRAAHDSQRISKTELDRVHAALVDNNYRFTRLSADEFVDVLRVSGWRIDRGAGAAVLRVAAEAAVLNPRNALIVGLALKRIWMESPSPAHARKIVLTLMKCLPHTQDASFARFIYRFQNRHLTVPAPNRQMPTRAGQAKPGGRLVPVRVKFAPFDDSAGRALKRFLRSWRSRDKELRPSLAGGSSLRQSRSHYISGRSCTTKGD